jgi:Na+/serine symporter
MEIIHQIIVESVSGGFWKFIGYWIMVALLLGIPAKVLIFVINRPLRHWTIRKHGYPPSHCDADGDFKDKNN